MRLYPNSPVADDGHVDCYYSMPESSQEEYDLPLHSSVPIKSKVRWNNKNDDNDNDKNKKQWPRWVVLLLDVLLVASLLAGCAFYFRVSKARATTKDILNRLGEAKLSQLQHKPQVRSRRQQDPPNNLLSTAKEQEAATEEQRRRRATAGADSVFHKLVSEAKKHRDFEDANANSVNERLSSATDEEQRRVIGRFRDHLQRLQDMTAQKKKKMIRKVEQQGLSEDDNHSGEGSQQQYEEQMFQPNDIVEFFDPNYSPEENPASIHLFAPHQIESVRKLTPSSATTLFDIVSLIDGRRKVAPARFLRLYRRYEPGTPAICNMGSFEVTRFFPCSVLKEEGGRDEDSSEEEVSLLDTYRVRIGPPAMRNNIDQMGGGYDLPIETVPIWMIQREEHHSPEKSDEL